MNGVNALDVIIWVTETGGRPKPDFAAAGTVEANVLAPGVRTLITSERRSALILYIHI